jgi:outer membrane protein assembly factor BamB
MSSSENQFLLPAREGRSVRTRFPVRHAPTNHRGGSRWRRTLWLAALISAGLAASDAVAAEGRLERFLPANGNNVYPAQNLLRSWPTNGPRELWRVSLGVGKSAVAETPGRLFTMVESNKQQFAVCLDPATGRSLWRQLLVTNGNSHVVKGPVSGVLADGDRVYCFPYKNENENMWKPHEPCFCLSAADGRVLWHEAEAYNCSEGTTPLIVGDRLYVGGGGRENILAAADKLTGRLLWKVAEDRDAGHKEVYVTGASLMYQEVGGVPQVVVAVYKHDLMGVHARDGRILWHWKLEKFASSGMVPTPVAIGERLFISASQNGVDYSACLEMSARDGGITPKLVYESTRLQCSAYHTPSVHDGAVFGFGRGTEQPALQCTSFDDGRLLWQQETPDWKRDRQLTVADGLIFALTTRDELVLAEASRAGYRELGRFDPKVKMGLPQQPMIANGRLYLRGDDTLACFAIAAP